LNLRVAYFGQYRRLALACSTLNNALA